jgi:ribosomal protein S18 acetylase RimI-like enzyme
MPCNARGFVLSGYFCRMSISRATGADVPRILRLVNSAYRGEEAKKGWTHESDLIEGTLRTDENSLKEMIGNPDAVILKYTENDQLDGCVYLKRQNDKLYLGMLSVSPDRQASGIGRKLLTAADEHAKNLNCKMIEMTVISARKELIAWYERLGYHVTEETKPFNVETKFGVPRQPIEFLVMRKIIG